MGMLIKGTFWFCVVLVVLPFFDGEAQKKLEGAPQVEAADAMTAATGALSYIGEMCAQRPEVCIKGAETVSALGNRAKEGALVAYKLLDKNFSDKPASATAGSTAARTWPKPPNPFPPPPSSRCPTPSSPEPSSPCPRPARSIETATSIYRLPDRPFLILPELAIFANAASLVPAAFSFCAARACFLPRRFSLYPGKQQTDRHDMASIEQIIEDFTFLDEWEDRYRYVIELGKALPDLPDSEKTAENKVQGCASQVWLVSHRGEGADPVMTFEGDSDAHIVRGLVAIVLAIYSGHKASEIVATDAIDTFNTIGLVEHLSSQRANGLRSMIKRIRAEAAAAA